MKRKILMALLFLIIAAATTSVVFATPATVNGIEFNIPDGYTPRNGTDYNANVMGLYHSSDDSLLMIIVYNNQTAFEEISHNSSYVPRNISGHEGYTYVNSENVTFFTFVENSKTVVIGTHNGNILESLIK